MIGRSMYMELLSPPYRSAWFLLRSCSTVGVEKAKVNNTDQPVNSEPRYRISGARGSQQTPVYTSGPGPFHTRRYFGPFRSHGGTTIPKTQSDPLSEDQKPPKDCEIEKAVTSFLPSVVAVTLSTGKGTKMYGGVIVDPLGYIVTSSEDMESQKKEYLSKFKVDVHLNPGMPSEYTLSGEVSYADLVNKFAIVKCKSNKPLQAAKLNNRDHHTSGFLLYLCTTWGQNRSITSSLVADLVKIVRPETYRPFPLEIVKSCIFASGTSTAPADNFGLAIVNLDGELVGIFNDCVNTDLCGLSKTNKENHLCATSANVVSKVIEIAKKHGTFQPWIGVDLCLIDKKGHSCLVRKVIPDSPADEAGVGVGDEIFRVELHNAPSFIELYNMSLLKLRRPLSANLSAINGQTEILKHLKIVPRLIEQAETPFI